MSAKVSVLSFRWPLESIGVAMSILRSKRFFCASILLPAFALAAANVYDYDKEVEEKPWAEVEAQLPTYPGKQDLIPFTVGAVTDTKYFIDGKSLAVGPDGVIRYTLVIVSSSGAQNISFEGMRCTTAERRVYAFGRSDGTWSKARNNRWLKVQGNSNNHNVELYTNYFCTIGAPEITSPERARWALRNSEQANKVRQ